MGVKSRGSEKIWNDEKSGIKVDFYAEESPLQEADYHLDVIAYKTDSWRDGTNLYCGPVEEEKIDWFKKNWLKLAVKEAI